MDIVDPFDQPTAKRGIVDPFDAPTPVSIMGPMAADAAAIKPFAAADTNAPSIAKALQDATDVGSTLASRLTPAAMLPMLAGGAAGIGSLAGEKPVGNGLADAFLPAPVKMGMALANPDAVSRAADAVTRTEEPLNYQPQTQAGKVTAAAPDYVFGKIGQGADYLGQKTTDVTGSPLAGAGVSTAAQLLPLLLGERAVRGGIGTAKAVRASDLSRGDQSIHASIDTDMHGITDRASLSDMLTKSATDTPAPTPADGLKTMLDQVKTTIAQGLAPKPNESESAPVQPPPPAVAAGLKAVTGGDPQKMAAVIQGAVGDKLKPGETPENLAAAVQSAKEPPNAANRPVATEPDSGGTGTGVDTPQVSPEAAARSAVLAEKPDAAPPLHPWTPVDTTKPIPLAGGVVEPEVPGGPQKVAIDPRIPQFVKVDGKDIDAHEAIGLHERTEKTLMEQGLDYADAHDLATKAENAFVAKKYGIDPQKYQDSLKPHIDNALKEASNDPNIPPTLDTKPYTDEGDGNLLTQKPEPASWVIREKKTGRTVMETFDKKKVAALNTEKYEAVPIGDHLGDVNRLIRKGGESSVPGGYDPNVSSDTLPPNPYHELPPIENEPRRDLSGRVVEQPKPAEPAAIAAPDTAIAAPDTAIAPKPDRIQELRSARDAGTATPEQLTELTHLQDTAAHTADVNGELIPGVLNARGREQLEASGQMKPVRVKTDLDDFKDINDTLGHDVGDQALKLKAEAMRDAFGPGNVWREGGDEFGAHADTEEAAHAAMQQVRDKLSGARLERVDDDGNVLGSKPMKVSYGVGRGKTPKEAAKAADNALYADKNARTAAGERTGRRSTDAGTDAARVGAGNESAPSKGQVPPGGSEEVEVADPPTQTAPSKPPPTKPVEAAAEPAPPKQEGTQIRNAAVDAQRDELGLDELPPAEREHWQDASDEARAGIASGDIHPRTLAAEVAAKPRALTTVETMALAHDLKSLSEERASAVSDALAARARGDTVAEAQALLRKKAALDAMETNHAALREGGTKTAQALSIRNAILKDDYTIGRNMDRAKLAYGDKLNANIRQEFEDVSGQLQDALAEVDRLKKAADARQSARKPKMTDEEKTQARLQAQIDKLQKTIEERTRLCPI